MKNRIFSRSIQMLIVGLLIALAAFRNQWAAIAVASAWLLFTVVRLFFVNRRRISHWLKKAMPRQQMQPDEDTEPQAPQQPQMMVVPEVSDSPSQVLLRHLNCRSEAITDGCCGMRELTSWVQSFMICGNVMDAAVHTVLSSVSSNVDNRDEISRTCLETRFA